MAIIGASCPELNVSLGIVFRSCSSLDARNRPITCPAGQIKIVSSIKSFQTTDIDDRLPFRPLNLEWINVLTLFKRRSPFTPAQFARTFASFGWLEKDSALPSDSQYRFPPTRSRGILYSLLHPSLPRAIFHCFGRSFKIRQFAIIPLSIPNALKVGRAGGVSHV